MKNLVLRTVTGVAFVAVMVGGILYSPLTLWLLFLVIAALSVWEFTGLINTRTDVQVNRVVTTATAVLLYAGVSGLQAGTPESRALIVPWLLSVAYLLIEELYLRRESPLNNWAYSLMAQVYIALPFTLLTLFAEPFHVMAIFIFLWCSDTGAYCTGSLIGRHKLFPRISPAKTWEGSVGGALLAIAASQIIAWLGPTVCVGECCATVYGLTAPQWALFALVVVLFGTWGDLIESLIKRQLGVKDSGNILPGHGGMLDRFDSSLVAIPAATALFYVLALL